MTPGFRVQAETRPGAKGCSASGPEVFRSQTNRDPKRLGRTLGTMNGSGEVQAEMLLFVKDEGSCMMMKGAVAMLVAKACCW